MKKAVKKFAMLLMTLALIVSLVACGETKPAGPEQVPEESTQETVPVAEPFVGKIVAASSGGNMHIISGALGQLIEQNLAGSKVTVETGESGSNPILVGNGEADIACTMYGNASAAVEGVDPYAEKVENVGAIANLGIHQWIAFITSNPDYSRLEDMVADHYPMRVVLGNPGSSSEVMIRRIFNELGVTYDDIKSWGGTVTHVGHSDAVSLMKDNHADVYATIPSLKFPQVVDLTTSKTVYFMTVDKETIDAVASKYGYLTGTLPGGTFTGQTGDYYSLMESQLYLANLDLVSEAQAYEITKILCENIDELKAAHSDMEYFDPATAWKDTGFDLHPGAARYYKEAGYMK